MRNITKLMLSVVVTISFILSVNVAFASPRDKIYAALSSRHLNYSETDLEKMAGGQENLVKVLLALRHDESLPYIGVRAQKLLLAYAEEESVQEALADDLRSAGTVGLARVVAVHIDRVPTQEARKLLAILAIERAEREPQFRGYARSLVDSKDEEISEIARKALR